MGRIRLANHPPPGRIVAAAGSRFHVHESGTGPATVVLEAGVAATSLSWALVQPEVARFARVISYDRAGYGWSDPIDAPRTPSRVAAELRAVLEAVKARPPYIFAGHSFGGLIVERFAIDHPRDVAGMVLVDPLSPVEFYPLTSAKQATLGRGIHLSRRGATLARLGVVRLCLGLVLGGNQVLPKLAARVSSGAGGEGFTKRLAGEVGKLPRDTWPLVAYNWSLPKSFETMARYLEQVPESCREMSNAQLPDVPVTLLLAAHNTLGAGVALPARARTEVAGGSGHWIQLDQPALVVEAIRAMTVA